MVVVVVIVMIMDRNIHIETETETETKIEITTAIEHQSTYRGQDLFSSRTRRCEDDPLALEMLEQRDVEGEGAAGQGALDTRYGF